MKISENNVQKVWKGDSNGKGPIIMMKRVVQLNGKFSTSEVPAKELAIKKFKEIYIEIVYYNMSTASVQNRILARCRF